MRAVLKVFVDALREGPDLPRQLHGQLGSRARGSAISDLEVEDREVTDTLYYVDYPLASGNGSITVATVRPGDDARRHRDRRAPRRRPLHAAGGGDGDPAADRAAAEDHRRPLRQARVRHRRAEDHAGARPERLRDRPRARPRRGDRDRRGRAHDRRRPATLRGPHRAGGARGGRRRAARGEADQPHRALRARGAVLAALGRADRAADLAAVVHAHGRARQAGDRGRRERARADPSRGPAAALPGVDATTSARGASRASCGGATGCRSGTAATRPTSAWTRRTGPAGSATRTCSTRGSPAACSRSRRSAGRTTRRS